MSNCLLIGGHGKVALLASRLLVEDGHSVTSIIRNPGHVHDVEETGATAHVLDIENASTEEIADAALGHDALIWSAGAGGGNPARTMAVDYSAAVRSMDAAAKAGVSRYVMVSYLNAGLDHGVPETDSFYAYAQAKAKADDYLRTSELDYTILGPGVLTLDAPSGMISVHDEKTPESTNTSRGNVVLVIHAVLGKPSTIGSTIGFTDGDTPISTAI